MYKKEKGQKDCLGKGKNQYQTNHFCKHFQQIFLHGCGFQKSLFNPRKKGRKLVSDISARRRKDGRKKG